jgi:hypothetical protein
MSDVSQQLVDEEFARFSAEVSGTFRPVPVASMPHWRRSRWRGRVWVAGLFAALVAAASAVALQPASSPPPPGIRIVDRPVRLAGASGAMALRFSDADHGWVLFTDCPAPGGPCTYHLGRTRDAGLSWQPVQPPPLSGTGLAVLLAVDDRMVLLGSWGAGEAAASYWITADGGATFTRSTGPDDLITAHNPGPYVPFEVHGTSLVMSRTGMAGAVPDVPGELRQLAQGRSGPLWAAIYDNGQTKVAWSGDAARTWQFLAPLPARGVLAVSPDGHDAWLLTDLPTRLWRLPTTPAGAGAAAVEVPGFPTAVDPASAAAVDGGGLLVNPSGTGMGFWRDGGFTRLDERLAGSAVAQVLRDGTMVLTHFSDDWSTVEVLRSADGRTWFRHTP